MAEYRNIPLALIDPPEYQFGFDDRYDLDDEFVADIKARGLDYPIIVEPNGDRFRLVDGMRRWTAVTRLNWIDVPCKIQGAGDSPAQEVQLKTSLLRVNQNHAEIAVLLMQLAQKYNSEIEPLMKATGQSEGWINDHLALLQGDRDVLQMLGENKINYAQAKVLNRCKNDALRADGLKFAVFDQIPSRKLEVWIKQNDVEAPGVAGVPEGATPPAPAVPNGDGGVRCICCGGDKDPQNIIHIMIHRWEWDAIVKLLQPQES